MPVELSALADFLCIPGRALSNALQLHYRLADGSEFGRAEQVTPNLLGMLATLTGLDAGDLKAYDLKDSDGGVVLRAACDDGGPELGATTTVERPVDSRLGVIRRGHHRWRFELTTGDVIGELGPASAETPQQRPILDGSGATVGTVTAALPEGESLLDIALDLSTPQVARNSGLAVSALRIQLPVPPDGPLRTFVMALPIAMVLGSTREGSWDP